MNRGARPHPCSEAWVFLALGAALGLRIGGLNEGARAGDLVALGAWFAVVFGLPLALVAGLALAAPLGALWSPLAMALRVATLAVACGLGSQVVTAGLLGPTNIWLRIAAAASTALMAGVFPQVAGTPSVALRVLGVCALAALAVGTPAPRPAAQAALLDPVRRPRPEPHRPLLLVGIDGLDPDTIHRMLAGGRLPNLGQIKAAGAHGELVTLKDSYSPIIWTTIATGKLPTKHGVKGTFRIPGVSIPISEYPLGIGCTRLLRGLASLDLWRSVPLSAAMRRVDALWNIASHSGLRVAVVGWWPSWPAEAVTGVMVTDRFWTARRARHALTNAIFPTEIGPRFDALMVQAEALPMELVAQLLPDRQMTREPGSLRTQLLDQVAADLSHVRAAIEAQRGADLTMVYLRSPDVFSHLVGGQSSLTGKQGLPEPGEYSEALGSIYDLVDRWIGDLVSSAGPERNVMLCSDHGFAWEGTEYSHTGYPPGFLAVVGPDVRPTALPPQHVADITPTALRLLGLPVGADMDGHPIQAALPGLVRGPAAIPTYETRMRRGAAPETALDDEIREGLRALGYVQ